MKKIFAIFLSFSLLLILASCRTYTGNYNYFSVDASIYGIETGYAIAFPKGSNLVNPVNEVLTKMENDNTLKCIESYWTKGKTDPCYNNVDFVNKVYTTSYNGNSQTINVLTSSGYEPFEMASASGELSGFDIDLANFIMKELNHKINWQDVDFDKIVGDLINNKADMSIAAITPTDERKQSVDFSNDYYTESFTVALYREENNFSSIDDLKDKIVSAQSGTVQAQLIEKLKTEGKVKDVKLLPYPATAMQSLKTNKIDAFFVEKSIADELIKSYNK